MRPQNNPPDRSAVKRHLDGEISQSQQERKKVRQHAIDAAWDGLLELAAEQIRLPIEDTGPGLGIDVR